MSDPILTALDEIDARFDRRYNDRKRVTAALRAALYACDAEGGSNVASALYLADVVREVVAGALGVDLHRADETKEGR